MARPKTGKEIIERLKKDFEHVYGLRFDDEGDVIDRLWERASDNQGPCERAVHYVQRQLLKLANYSEAPQRPRARGGPKLTDKPKSLV